MKRPGSGDDPRGARRVRLLATVALGATFLGGAAAGIAVRHLVAPDEPRPTLLGPAPAVGPGLPPGSLGDLAVPPPFEQVALTPEQVNRMRAVTARYRPELERVMREALPRVRALTDRLEDELRGVLTPEQQTKLDELRRALPPGGPGAPELRLPFDPPPAPPPSQR